jgi:GTP-binding protein
MRTIADICLIGHPNVGKSTLLRAISAATPKVAAYPFTTLRPELGVVHRKNRDITVAEVPGLVEGAHKGKGLGRDFLRHVMRTRLLVHLVDGTSATPEEDVMNLNTELLSYDSDLERVPQLVVVNKLDLPEVRLRWTEITEALARIGLEVCWISAATGEGVETMLGFCEAQLVEILGRETFSKPVTVLTPPVKDSRSLIMREGNLYVVNLPDLARVTVGTGGTRAELLGYLMQCLKRRGIHRILLAMGVQAGDRIRIGRTEWEWPPNVSGSSAAPSTRRTEVT